MSRLCAALLVSLAVAGASAHARAQLEESAAPDAAQANHPAPSGPDERARFREAMRLYGEQRYAEVLPILQALQAASSEPLYLFNLGQTYRQLGQCAAAVDAYERFLEAHARDPAPHRQAVRDSAREYLRALQPCPAPPASSSIAPAPAAPAPAPPAGAATAPARSPRPSGALWAASVLFGVGAAGAVAASYWGIKAHALETSLEDRYGGEMPARWDEQAEQDLADGDRYALRARWACAAAALSVAAGGLVLLLTRRDKRATRDLSVLPRRAGAEVGWTTSF